jgi:hypothetical protein
MLANPTPPTIHVYPAADRLRPAMGAARQVDVHGAGVRGAGDDIGAQVKLDAFLAPSGSQSVKAAIEADGTLGGIVADTNVVSCTGYRVYARGAAACCARAEWQVEVLASGI